MYENFLFVEFGNADGKFTIKGFIEMYLPLDIHILSCRRRINTHVHKIHNFYIRPVY